MPGGAAWTSPRMPRLPSQTPSAPPIAPSNKLSVSIRRKSCHRDAPSAARIAASRIRPGTRASERFARFRHTINRTAPTAASKRINPRRAAPTTSESSGKIAAFRSTSGSLICWTICPWTTFSSATAWAGVTPGFKRPMGAKSNSPMRSCSSSFGPLSGSKKSRRSGKLVSCPNCAGK